MKILYILLVLFIFSCSDECKYDTDCSEDFICSNGSCKKTSDECSQKSDCYNPNKCGEGIACDCNLEHKCVEYDPCNPSYCVIENRTICNVIKTDKFYECLCNEGFHLEDDKCVETCNDTICNSGTCRINNDGLIECSCSAGYTGKFCDKCSEGFQDNDNNKTCFANCKTSGLECEEGICDDSSGKATCVDQQCIPKCESNAHCNNNKCECNSGYEGDPSACKEINKCILNPCQNGGICKNKLNSYSCTCTRGFEGENCEIDKCINMTCDDNNSCTKNECYAGVCNFSNFKNEDTSCDDNNKCTINDKCHAGICLGEQKDCDDALSCTEDSCENSTGECTSVIISGNCLIGNHCYHDGNLNPENSCLICSAAHVTRNWSIVSNGSRCDDGVICTSNDFCSNGVCEGISNCPHDGICDEYLGTCIDF